MKKLPILFCFISFFLFSEDTVEFITVVKSGTHVVKKCVDLIKKESGVRDFTVNSDHYHFTKTYFKNIKKVRTKIKDFSKKYIVNIRDPRDVAISSMHWMNRPDSDSQLFLEGSGILKKEWGFMPPDIRLIKVLIETLINQYRLFYGIYQENYPNVLLVRFENLVGEKGGGSLALQLEEIQKISKFLEVDLSDEQVKKIANNLFGDTKTFRKGLIGGHKRYFKQVHYKVFKKVFSDLLEPLSKWYDFT